MRSTLLALSLIALVACKACGQLTVDVVKYQELTGLPTPTLVGSKVLVESLNLQSLAVRPVALVMVGSSEAEVRVEGSDINRNSVRLERLDDGAYFISNPGKTWVDVREYAEFEINGVKRKFLVDQKSVVVELGPAPPPPPPPPPPGTCDSKTNSNLEYLAKRACQWVADVKPTGLSRREAISKLYLKASNKLSSGEHLTINAASAEVRADWDAVLNTPELKDAWAAWNLKANEEVAKWWVDQTTNTAKREMMVQLFRSLGEGLQP